MPDKGRRKLLGAMGSGLVASAVGSIAGLSHAQPQPVRWGFVGTGSIANSMAAITKIARSTELVAVSSRRMETANAFAAEHGVGKAFDSWAEMLAWDGIDAVYVATPTSVREEICVAAAKQGKHVLGEKPFASLPSVRRIIAACRENNVGFMDGTHFVHHPRTSHILSNTEEQIGWAWSVDSAFQFKLSDRANIRFNPDLEPMGAIGDTGWYNMRAAVQYLPKGISLRSTHAVLRRDEETGAAISGSGVMQFDDGSTSTWNCGFDSGAVIMDLRISGPRGAISIDNFLSQDADGSANYLHRGGGWGPRASRETVTIDSALPGSALMFERFAALVAVQALRNASMQAAEDTQALLDAAWESAIQNEGR